MMRVGIVAAALVMGLPVVAGAASLQEQFDAAQAAVEQGDFAKAAAGYEKVLASLPQDDPNNRTVATVRSRLGSVRLQLRDYEGAEDVLASALPGLAGEASRDERRSTLYELGKAREGLLDYAGAREAWAALIAEVEADRGVAASDLAVYRIALARVSLFDDPDLARQQLDLALPVIVAKLDGKNDLLGELYTLRGRADLMAGKLQEAYDWFRKALEAAGGLGTRVSVSDMRIRGDLALAAQLMGRETEARKYMAYSGAGLLRDKDPLSGAVIEAPPCGDATGLRPDDAAVVEFAVGDDGQVFFAQPVYATRTGPVALEFARAVSGWSWTPEELKNVPQFWRSSVRLEMRCTKEPQRLDIKTTFWNGLAEWLAARGAVRNAHTLGTNNAPNASALAAELRSLLAEKEAALGKDDLSLLHILVALGGNPSVPGSEARAFLARAQDIAAAHDAPADVRVLIRYIDIRREAGRFTNRKYAAVFRKGAEDLLSELEGRNEAASRGAAWVLIDLAADRLARRDPEKAEQFLQRVISMPEAALPADDVVRQTAVVHLASLKAAAQQFDKADGLLQSAGLNPEQCSLLNVRPVPVRQKMGSSDFPKGALYWGFEGWVRVSYDIDEEGRVMEPRAILAYPPFVFGSATEEAVSRFRYQPMYWGGQTVGCTGYELGINYRMPR